MDKQSISTGSGSMERLLLSLGVVELVPNHADVEPCVRPCKADCFIHRTHVGDVGLVLHHLHFFRQNYL